MIQDLGKRIVCEKLQDIFKEELENIKLENINNKQTVEEYNN